MNIFLNNSNNVDRVLRSLTINPFGFFQEAIYPVDSSKVGFYTDFNIIFINVSQSILTLDKFFDKNISLGIVHDSHTFIGVISSELLEKLPSNGEVVSAKDIAIPWNSVPTIKFDDAIDKAIEYFNQNIDTMVVLNNDKPVGVLKKEVFSRFTEVKKLSMPLKAYNDIFKEVIDGYPEGIIITDESLHVVFCNKKILNTSNYSIDDVIGKHLEIAFGSFLAKSHWEFSEVILKNMQNCRKGNVKIYTERSFRVNLFKQDINKKKHFVIRHKDMNKKIKDYQTQEELMKAFRLMFPHPEVEGWLKKIPEYEDIYQQETGLIQILDIIHDGGYRHVINCLKILSDLDEKGLFQNNELKKDDLIKTLILHDIGKSQPVLQVGDIVNPRKYFQEGWKHARESARIISRFPYVPPDVVKLVFYHHHDEKDLPPSFPIRLIPMFKIVKLIDGLSAGLTRSQAEINISVEGSKIIVVEENPNPRYTGIKQIDLFAM